ncbi:MAG: hypothetical protein A2847_00075 [Candidatus Sungbacteria bacterium RIFCSPHIGHO2_01_FULL_50_25]|uniref:EfeO-type cupredoxin-like domain-containing protein n=1 Tax=Candidatus Sungbacteria bacterium RIFCSPHIGHO2_01_FULL_50_25 TaxID=1802265 RepID=A0A1G2K996_9BACT|nr:MAG: hypothetical protein A2847_00075 [Candidatus Sungbacteria bacterium RIFCSPHIGHO2_01_FULL_50_25]
MNKYIILFGVLILVVAGGVIYRIFLIPESSKPVSTGVVREITIVAKKDEWRFMPEAIEVERGDTLVVTAVNEDSYDHGIGIDAFGISQKMPANSTIRFEFVVTQEGDFPFYCSVPCGEGDINGMHRTHFDMIGKIQVHSAVSGTQ